MKALINNACISFDIEKCLGEEIELRKPSIQDVEKALRKLKEKLEKDKPILDKRVIDKYDLVIKTLGEYLENHTIVKKMKAKVKVDEELLSAA